MRRVFVARVVLLALLGLLVLATIGGLLWLGFLVGQTEALVDVRVTVDPSTGPVLFDGVVASAPDVHSALAAAGALGGFEVVLRDGEIVRVGAHTGPWEASIVRGEGNLPPNASLRDGDWVRFTQLPDA